MKIFYARPAHVRARVVVREDKPKRRTRKLRWVTRPPEAPGFYWVRSPFMYERVTEVFPNHRGDLFFYGKNLDLGFGNTGFGDITECRTANAEWSSGPIVPPVEHVSTRKKRKRTAAKSWSESSAECENADRINDCGFDSDIDAQDDYGVFNGNGD